MDEFDLIVKKIKKAKITLDSIEEPVFSVNYSTVERVVLDLNNKKYFNYFGQLDYLQSIIYQAYYSETYRKTDLSYSTPKDEFNDYIYLNRPVKEIENVDVNWEFNRKRNVLRKKSESYFAKTGEFILSASLNKIRGAKNEFFKKAVSLFPRFKFSEDFKEGEKGYNWIIGKYQKFDEYTLRFYLNILPKKELISELLKFLQDQFDSRQIPFSYKFLSNPSDYYGRTDVSVLYVPRKNSLAVFKIIADLHLKFRDSKLFKSSVPMFTRKLAPGIGFGENPDDRLFTSFGSYRAIAINLIAFDYFLNKKSFEDFNSNYLRHKLDYFSLKKNNTLSGPVVTTGIPFKLFTNFDFNNWISESSVSKLKSDSSATKGNSFWTERFYVNHDSNYDYKHEIVFFEKILDYSKSSPSKIINSTSDYLEIAIKIGNYITNEAYCYPDSTNEELNCNWISCFGMERTIYYGNQESRKFTFKSLDNSLLEGKIGVAHFLINLFRATSDKFHYTLAYRAIKASTKPNDNYDLQWFFKVNPRFRTNQEFLKIKKQDFILRKDTKFSRDNEISSINKIFDKLVFTDEVLDQGEYDEVEIFMDNFSSSNTFLNFQGNEEICLTLKEGYSLVGYAFLRLTNRKKFKKLPFQVEYNQNLVPSFMVDSI